MNERGRKNYFRICPYVLYAVWGMVCGGGGLEQRFVDQNGPKKIILQ